MRFFCFFLLSTISFFSNAQQKFEYNYEERQLNSVLYDLQQLHKIKFSFASDQIEDKRVSLFLKSASLHELLEVLEAQTGLVFSKISENQIIVVPQKKINIVCGYLLDKTTRTPISFTTVQVIADRIFNTDKKGFFAIPKTQKSEYKLKVVGYDSITISKSEVCSTYYLNPIVEQLDEVVVTGYITTGINRAKYGSIDISQKTLGILPGLTTPDIFHSIQMIPGISSLDETVSDIQIRGGSPAENLILFDDIKIFGSSYFYGMLSSINPYAANKATIYKSGTNAIYGDRISGVIDISSGTEIPNKANYSLGMDGLSIDGYFKAPITDKTAFYFFGRKSYTELLKNATYNGYAKKIFNNKGIIKDMNGNILEVDSDYEFTDDQVSNDFIFNDISAKVIHAPSKNDQITFSGLFTNSILKYSFTGGNELKLDSLITKNNGLSFKWNHRFSNKKKFILKTYYSNHKSYYENQEFINSSVVEETNIRGNKIIDFGLNMHSSHKIDEKSEILFGYQYSFTKINTELSKEKPELPEDNYSFPSNEKNTIHTIFGQYTCNIKTNGAFMAGMRIGHYANFDKINFEPRLNLQYPLSKSVSGNLSFEIRNQSILQLIEFNHTELRLENNIWQLSDGSKYPLLNSRQISGGFLFDNKALTIDIEGYYKKNTGLSSFSKGFATPELLFSEGSSTIKGIDFLFKKRIQNYRVWLGYTFNDIKYKFPSIQKNEFSGNNDITHSLRISNSIKAGKFQFSLGWILRSGKPYTAIESFDPSSSKIGFGSINNSKLTVYHRLDASALYFLEPTKKTKHRLQFGISGLNLYNRKVPISITYRTDETENGPILKQVIQHFSLGFTPNFLVRILFD